jgi:hypothetical protein
MSKAKVYERKIKDITWRFYMQTQRAYVRDHGNDSDAVTYPHDRECYFNKPRFLPSVIRHELIHIYAASASVSSANQDADQREETIAELYECHGPEMQIIEDEILDFFMRHG